MDVVGYEEGTLLYIGVEAGKSAKVNDIIAIVGKPGTDVSAFVEAQKNAPQQSEEKAEATPARTNYSHCLLLKIMQHHNLLL